MSDTIYLNGAFLCNDTKNYDVTPVDSTFIIPAVSANSITWGSWKDGEPIIIKTGGLKTSVIAGLIALKVGWCTAGVASAVAAAVAGKYDVLKVTTKIRYGKDKTYSYYERKTWFYGDGKLIHGPVKSTGKTDGSGVKSIESSDFI